MMERDYVIGDIKAELEEIEHMDEKIQETNNNLGITYAGSILTLLCC